jgi:glycosyltransferase involved in cell wall biosynthesis
MSAERIKVLQAIRQGAIGGGETHILDLLAHLDPQQYEPVVLTFTGGAMVDRLRDEGVRTHVIDSSRAFDFSVWKQVLRFISNEKVQLVHMHGTRACTNVLLPGYWSSLPLIYTVHGWSFHNDQSWWVRRSRIWVERAIVKSVAATITVSEANKVSGQEEISGFSPTVIPNGVSSRRFNPTNPQPDLRAELGIAPHVFLIAYIARITKQKAPLTMLKGLQKAVEQARPDRPIHLLMVGEGDMLDETKQAIVQWGLAQHVTLQGFRTDVPALLAAADIYCLPSLWEGLPIGLLEAMAMQKPVIATAVDGTLNIIKHQYNGLLIEPSDEQALAGAILQLYNNPVLSENIARQALATVQEQYSASGMTRQVEKLYQQVLGLPSTTLSSRKRILT